MGDNDYLYRRLGAAQFPPDLTAEPETFYAAIDPDGDRILSLLRQALLTELSATWALAVAGSGLAGKTPIETVYRATPTKAQLRAQRIDFPALFLARVRQSHREYSLGLDEVTTTWGLDYILGPVTAADYQRLGAVTHAAMAVIRMVIRDRRHPAFESGAVVFDPTIRPGLKAIRVVGSEFGVAEMGERDEGLEFVALHVDLETDELETPMEGVSAPYQGVTATLDSVTSEEVFPAFVVGRT